MSIVISEVRQKLREELPLSVMELASLIGISECFLRKAVRQNRVRVLWFGRKMLIPAIEVRAILRDGIPPGPLCRHSAGADDDTPLDA